MTRKRFTKLLMGRDRFNRNEARLLAESVQVMQRFADRVNHIAKSSGKQYRETWRGYAWNWNHRDEAETGIIVKYYGKAYCPHCRKIVPHGLQDTERTYSQGRLEFTYIERAIFCDKCGEPLYVSAIDYENPELRIEEIRNRLRRRKICEKL